MGAMSIAHAPLSEEEDKPEKPHSARVPPIKYILSYEIFFFIYLDISTHAIRFLKSRNRK